MKNYSTGDLYRFHENWWILLLLGASLIILGLVAIGLPLAATFAVEIMVGWVILLAGVIQLVHLYLIRETGAFFVRLLISLLYLAAGVLALTYPLVGMLTLTMLLTWFFIITGVVRILAAVQQHEYRDWGWMLFNGIVTLFLGIILFSQSPVAAIWMVGLIVGIDLIAAGFTLMAIGFMLESYLPREQLRPMMG